MTEKMTYEKLFKALLAGKKVRHKDWCVDAYSVLEDEDIVDIFSDIQKVEIIEYDMTYREALMYMLENPKHQASYENSLDIFSLDISEMAFRVKDTVGWRAVPPNAKYLKWRKEPDWVWGESGTDTDVATKKHSSGGSGASSVSEGGGSGSPVDPESMQFLPEAKLPPYHYRDYKKGDKLLTPAEVFRALLAGEKVKFSKSHQVNPSGDGFLVMKDGYVMRCYKHKDEEVTDSNWFYESNSAEWWEIAE